MKKRILVLLAVVALMMVMLVGGATSGAFAHDVSCTGNNAGLLVPAQTATNPDALAADRDQDGYVCFYPKNNGNTLYKDDHQAP